MGRVPKPTVPLEASGSKRVRVRLSLGRGCSGSCELYSPFSSAFVKVGDDIPLPEALFAGLELQDP